MNRIVNVSVKPHLWKDKWGWHCRGSGVYDVGSDAKSAYDAWYKRYMRFISKFLNDSSNVNWPS